MKSKFIQALEAVMKEVDGGYTMGTTGTTSMGSTEQDPEKMAQNVAGAAQQAGAKEKEAINAANKAFIAAVQSHPALKGDLAKINPDFIKTLQTIK